MNSLKQHAADPAMTGFRPPAIPDVQVRGFWGERIDAVADRTVHILYDRCLAAGMFDQIDPSRPVPELRLKFHPYPDGKLNTVNAQMFWDSDVAKVIEAAAYALYRHKDPELESKIDAVIDMFARLQQPDGYLNSWYIRMQPGLRWTNLRDCHELYCAGHLMEAAVAYYQATGKRQLLDVMCRYADHIDATFGPEPDKIPGYCGHEEIELALVRLSRQTGEQRYMNLAKFFIDARGQQPHYFDIEAKKRDPGERYQHGTYEYNQSHLPVRQQTKVVGHAVRAMYLYAGMADIAAEFGDDSLTKALQTLWDDLTTKQMYVTGGIGPAAANEGFTDYYDLPNESAYAETCASVGLVFWASRMLGRTPDRIYGDIMEQALYNGALAGLAADGAKFFYENPLESRGGHHRWTWHSCPCCPPNIARIIASIGTYMYASSASDIAVHLYGESTARLRVANTAVTLEQQTQYPWNGEVGITVQVDAPTSFALCLRIPAWAESASISVNGAFFDNKDNRGYARIEREWRPGDKVELRFAMEVRPMHANPKVMQDLGRVAMTRGPLVYCLEGIDNPEGLQSILVPKSAPGAVTSSLPSLGNAVAIDIPVLRESLDAWGNALYSTKTPDLKSSTARFVPYHLWDNREPGEMLVWVRSQS
jgi:DUF1680 family protein